MKTQSITSTTQPLSGGYYTITRNGQQSPSMNDAVVVEFKLFLPTEAGVCKYLREDLRFDRRVMLDSDPLSSGWGINTNNGPFRWRTREFSAHTWLEAFNLAAHHGDALLNKLESALTIRAAALLAADQE